MKIIRTIFVLGLIFFIALGCSYEVPEEEDVFVISYSSMPNSLNVFIDYNSFTIQVSQLLYETLCERDMETWELKPRLAESWTVSEDKLTFTFVLDKDAKWADGTPVTTEDVMFTYNTIMNPDNLTGIFRMDYENSFEEVYAVDEHTVVFKARNKRWVNFISAYSFAVLPKNQYEGKDFNKDFNLDLPPGSGPYIIESVETDRFITLKKREDYWCRELPNKKDIFNFNRIKFKFINEDAIMLEAMKKGEIDLMLAPSAKYWIEWTRDNPPEQLKKNWILAKRIWNYQPQGYQAFHMNLRRDIFKDVRVRKALALLLNVDLINEKIMYNQYIPLRSYFPDFFNNDEDLPLFGYDPEEARRLLAEAGWDSVDTEGVLLNKKGERFEIEFLYTHQSLEKHITIFKEDCKKVGIRVNLNLISDAAYRKKVFEDYEYDITWVAWGRGNLFPGVEDGWKSDRADVPNTNNIVGYKNTELDKLIDLYLEEFDIEKRTQLLKQIDTILTNDVPTILLWGAPYTRIYYWNKFGMIPTILKKYARYTSEDSPYTNWWIDANKLSALTDARQNNTELPLEPIEVPYDNQIAPLK